MSDATNVRPGPKLLAAHTLNRLEIMATCTALWDMAPGPREGCRCMGSIPIVATCDPEDGSGVSEGCTDSSEQGGVTGVTGVTSAAAGVAPVAMLARALVDWEVEPVEARLEFKLSTGLRVPPSAGGPPVARVRVGAVTIIGAGLTCTVLKRGEPRHTPLRLARNPVGATRMRSTRLPQPSLEGGRPTTFMPASVLSSSAGEARGGGVGGEC
jgi:hypothetical protein